MVECNKDNELEDGGNWELGDEDIVPLMGNQQRLGITQKVWVQHQRLKDREQGLGNVGFAYSSSREFKKLGSFSDLFIMDYKWG